MKNKKFNTRAIRQGYHATEQQEHSAAVFLTSSFTFDSAEQAANRFANEEEGNVYTRFTNPNVKAFEDRLADLEEAESCINIAFLFIGKPIGCLLGTIKCEARG